MRKITVGCLMSLDGVTADPRSWASAYFDERAVSDSLAKLERTDAMLMGRGAYEYFQPAWSGASGPYMDRINAIRKYVFSSTLDAVDWSNAELVRDDAAAWGEVLARPGATVRPDPGPWSPPESACHVRDVHRVFAERVALVLAEDGPTFADWDQDATAVEDRYDLQQPTTVLAGLEEAAERVAAAYDAVLDDAWGRPGLRSNGSAFTLDTLGRYHLHDLVHHQWDVRLAGS